MTLKIGDSTVERDKVSHVGCHPAVYEKLKTLCDIKTPVPIALGTHRWPDGSVVILHEQNTAGTYTGNIIGVIVLGDVPGTTMQGALVSDLSDLTEADFNFLARVLPDAPRA